MTLFAHSLLTQGHLHWPGRCRAPLAQRALAVAIATYEPLLHVGSHLAGAVESGAYALSSLAQLKVQAMYNHTNRAVRELNVAVSDGAIAPLAWVWQIATATSSYVDKIYDEFNTEADPFFNERIGCERGALLGRLTALPEALIASAATILCAAEFGVTGVGKRCWERPLLRLREKADFSPPGRYFPDD